MKVSQRWDLVLGLYLVVMGLALLDLGIVGLIRIANVPSGTVLQRLQCELVLVYVVRRCLICKEGQIGVCVGRTISISVSGMRVIYAVDES